MRIAVWHDLPSGGGKRALYQHVRGLVDRGHFVESWCLDTADQTYLPLSQLVTEHVCPLHINGNQNISDAEREAALIEAFDDACRRCAAEIEDGGFDLLFANTAQRFHVPYVLKYVQIPKVLYLQEPCRPLYEAGPILPWISADHEWLEIVRARARQEWFSARSCDTILVNSYFSRESVARTFGIVARICYLGIDTSLFQHLNLERQRFVVGVGSFSYNKRIDLAVEALALLPQPRPPLVWISNSRDADYQNEVERLAESLGVDLRVRLAVSDADLVATLNQAALFIYTSRLEPFGLAVLEANACGLPVIAVAEGGVRETVKDGFNGFLVEPDPAALADATERLLRKPGLARRMGENGIAYVQEKWNLKHSGDRLEGLLNRVVSRNKSLPDKTKPIGHDRIATEMMEQLQSAADGVARDRDFEARVACTIVAKNYLAFARTFAQSFLSFHSGGRVYVLIVDDFEGFMNPSDECFETIKLNDLSIPDVGNLTFRYDLTELCTSVKARFLEYLIEEKSLDKVLYFDPDILVTGQLERIYDLLDHHDIVLTPHLNADFPNDGMLPDDGYILRAGLFNLGFIAINSSENARSFLTWWKAKLYEKCVVDVANGYFVDQKFIDLVPLLFRNVFIENGPGYNVAYWNLHSRQLGRDNGSWTCNGGPLFFYHFSGYSPQSDIISRYIPSLARYRLSGRADLRPLFSEYERLLNSNSNEQARTYPYTFGFFKTGEPITHEHRLYYRACCAAGETISDPFDSERIRHIGVIPENGSKPCEDVPEKTADASVHPEVTTQPTAQQQLDAFLSTRAWRWAARYGRFKYRFLLPAYNGWRRLFGGRGPQRNK